MASDPDSAVKTIIAGALRDTINAHGPIDNAHLGSATKRVLRQLQGAGYLFDVRRETTDALFMAEPMPCFICGLPTARLDINFGAAFCNSQACNKSIEDDLRGRDHREQ
jgi:hypothetical protein